MFDWNDLKYLVALAEHGSTLAAARALQVNASTVQRRLLELEQRIGQPLVRREPTGYHLTDYGRELVPLAQRVAAAVAGLELHVQAKRDELVGTIRVTCPEPLAQRITKTQLLDRFHARHPGLRVEWVMSDKYLDIAKGDADVALRSGDVEDSELVGRKVADSLWGVYASRQYLEQHGRPERIEDLGRHNIVGFDESMAQHRMTTWLRAVAPGANIVARNNSVLGLLYSVKAGVGIAALPLPLGKGEPELVQLFGPVPELTRIWRLLTRPEIRHTPRIAAFFDFVLEEIDALRPILSG
jgi:DNA-binding transcriptional LysR family regulator